MKKILIPILMLLILIGIASAATVVNLDPQGILANNTYQTSSTINYNINVTGNQSIWTCWLYTTENGSNGAGSWTAKQTNYPVTNNTNTNFTARTSVADATGIAYAWDVFCNGSTDATGDWGVGSNSSQTNVAGNMTFGVDITDPIVTILAPSSNGVWYTAGTSANITLTINDTNAAQCVVSSNLNISTNNTGNYVVAWNTTTYTTDTQYTMGQMTGSYDWADNNTGAYLWTYTCNDSAGNEAILGSNYTFYVDSTDPTAFIFDTSLWKTDNRNLWNATTATDYTPQIGWNATVEFNFSRYTTCYFKDAYGIYNASTDVCKNETSISTLSTNITTLGADSSYVILITAYDEAGNAANMSTLHYKYSTDSTNRALSAGWNIVGNVGNAMTLSAILNNTGATTVSIWNSTHEFQSHVSGGSYGTTSVSGGDTVLIYVAADTTFSDLIWNATAVSEEAHLIVNSSSSGSNSAWNLFMMRDDDDDKTFQEIDSYTNCNAVGSGCASSANNATNIDYFSLYNNSASAGSKYIPFVANWSINNATPLGYGNTVWLYADRNVTINWTAVS